MRHMAAGVIPSGMILVIAPSIIERLDAGDLSVLATEARWFCMCVLAVSLIRFGYGSWRYCRLEEASYELYEEEGEH